MGFLWFLFPLKELPKVQSIINCQLEKLHAAGDSQAGCDSRQDGDYRLNDEFPSFFLHDFSRLVV